MLFCKDITKSFGNQTLFEGADFQLNSGERVGMVGRNGAGKSTLFRLILGEDVLDEGSISFPEHYQVGALDQHLVFTQDTILQEVAQSLPPEREHDLWKAEKLLSGLGFAVTDFARSADTFSGGFQIRVKLAQLLLSEPDLLLLDEPTNYLDILAIRWMERFLNTWKNEVICISHDQAFLQRISTHTLAVHRKQFKKIKGSPQKCYEQIEREEELHERTRENQKKEIQKQEKFINEFRSGARSAGLVQSRIKMLEKKKRIEVLPPIPPIRFQFMEAAFTGDRMIDAHNLSFGYKKGTDLLKKCSFKILPGEKIGIIGANGKGKSTLLQLLDGQITQKSGTLKIHQNAAIGYMGQSHKERMDPRRSILEELQSVPGTGEQAARNIAGSLLFSGGLAHKTIRVLSGGEKSRVNLGKILLTPVNLLLLDEPTNHLDYQSSEAFITAIQHFTGAVIFVSHNEAFLREVAEKLIVFDGENVFFYEHNYERFLRDKGFQSEIEEEAQKSEGSTASPADSEAFRERKKEKDRIIRRNQRKIDQIKKQILEKETAQEKNTEAFKVAQRQDNRYIMEKLGMEYQELQKEIEVLWEEWNTLEEELKSLDSEG